jgi:GH15 family glucan-1,4-alpha-glucosidase
MTKSGLSGIIGRMATECKGDIILIEEKYKPISDYGIIGNLRTVALIAKDGSIDWWCLPRMDNASVFAAILDADGGGFCRVSPLDAGQGVQEYEGDTNVLKTRFKTEKGILTVTDFMPLDGDINGRNNSHGPPEIHRIIECEGDPTDVEVVFFPRLEYGREPTAVEPDGKGRWIARCGEALLSIDGLENEEKTENSHGPILTSVLRVNPKEPRVIVLRSGEGASGADPNVTRQLLEKTLKTWTDWAHREGLVDKRVWAGEQSQMVTRSALVFKLMNNAETGSIAAAPTTSLPEEIGGVRNWDYRYAWIRDAAMTAQALISIGHEAEAMDLLFWFEEVSKSCATCKRELQIMYGLHGETDLDEYELDHFEGYKGSKPVNIGNAAYSQFQLEVYGELVSTAYELARRGHEFSQEIGEFIAWIADHVVDVWERPDYGIWEVRGGPKHFVYSKVMAWVALDRAILLAKHFGLKGDVNKWETERERMREEILEKGFDKELNAFVQAYGSKDMDAVNLRLALVDFLPSTDPRIQGTVNRIMDELMTGCLVKRYISDDGLPGEEGAFSLCTFWLIDVLSLSKRVDEADALFNKMVAFANPLGLYSEMIDPETKEFLGNYPQAFTHIGLINSTLYLAYATGLDIPETHPIGTPEHREIRSRREGKSAK